MFFRSTSLEGTDLAELRRWRKGSGLLFLIGCGAGAAGLWGMALRWGFLTFAVALWVALIAGIRFAFLSFQIWSRSRGAPRSD